ncbi:MAG: ferredoxin family protein [Chloroflexi bacterium]|nr:ferredoxin family protein [Chloroflexota bacterium]
MKDIATRRHFTVPREEIPWHPTIDDQRCDRCGVCLSFCPKDVFEVDMATGAVQVVRPAACVFLCTGCVAQCASDAISFPDREPFRKYVYYR